MNKRKITKLGMRLHEWQHKSCTAEFAVGKNWATLYYIESKKEGQGHATQLLAVAKQYYEEKGKKFGGSIALNERMRSIYKKLDITEYDDSYIS
jgi:hypothetical protein